LNGAAARQAAPGDKVIILSYTLMSASEIPAHRARIVLLGENNQILSRREEAVFPGADPPTRLAKEY
jgi:aspartate 1-decarboxylase